MTRTDTGYGDQREHRWKLITARVLRWRLRRHKQPLETGKEKRGHPNGSPIRSSNPSNHISKGEQCSHIRRSPSVGPEASRLLSFKHLRPSYFSPSYFHTRPVEYVFRKGAFKNCMSPSVRGGRRRPCLSFERQSIPAGTRNASSHSYKDERLPNAKQKAMYIVILVTHHIYFLPTSASPIHI